MAEGEGGTEGGEGEGEGKTTPTPEEKATAAEAKAAAAEEKAAAAEERAAKLAAQAEAAAAPKGPPAGGYTLGSFREDEWAAAEARTNKTRDELLSELNHELKVDNKVKSEVGVLRAKIDLQNEQAEMAAEEPLYPKMRKSVNAFMADIPETMLRTPAERKKWLTKAFDVAKKETLSKLPNGGRTPQSTNVNESGKGEEGKKKSESYSLEEIAAIESNGKKVEDYDKIKHPYFKDGVMLKDRPAAPSFGPK